MPNPMTTTRRRFWLGAAMAALAVTLSGAGCGKTESIATGETHFLRACAEGTCGEGYTCLCGACTKPCQSDATCAREQSSATCVSLESEVCADAAAVCDVACTSDADCRALGSDYECSDGSCRAPSLEVDDSQSAGCAAGCTPVTGHPVRAEERCVDLGEGEVVGCSCGEATEETSLGAACRVRISDGSLWAIPAEVDLDESDWGKCESTQEALLVSSCDFASCETPPPSLCSREAMCGVMNCGGFVLDADGCGRTSCTTDEQCQDDERCVSGLLSSSSCRPTATDACACSGLTIALRGALCHPVSEVGPRGAWQKLTILDYDPTCPEPECRTEWQLTPDGVLTRAEDGATPATSQFDAVSFNEVVDIIDGLELRTWLESGGDCDGLSDWIIEVSLELEGSTLSADIAGCYASELANPATTLYEYVTSE